jgi:hypothetical protein
VEHVEALPPSEPETPSEKIIQKTPWWAISTGLHAVMALLIGLFWAVHAEEEVPFFDVRRFVPPPKPPEMTGHKIKAPVPIELPERTKNPSLTLETDEWREDPTDEIFEKARGQSEDFVAEAPFSGRSRNDAIGAGGGAAGRKGGPFGGRVRRRPGGGGGPTPETEDAVLSALRWLARHQNADGSWSVAGYTKRCTAACTPNPGHEDFDAGVAGLSMLAFLGAGYSHLSKDTYDGICFGDVVRRGLQWMAAHQDPEGCVGSRAAQKYMYNHTICALALTEAYGLTGTNLVYEAARKAVDFTLAAQNPGKGWRYSYKCGDNDSSVTGWAVMVLKSAELSALPVPPAGYDGTRAWYDEATEESYARVGYTHKGTGKVFVPGLNEHFEHHEALTAIAVMARIFMDKTKADPRVANGADLLLRDKPRWEGNAIDFYYWYYASLALFQYDGPKGAKWKQWNEPMAGALVKNQNAAPTGCRAGSWEPVDRWSPEGGRVYATAINALTLEVYYRYANVFGGR